MVGCAGKAVCGKLVQPRTSSCLGPTSFVCLCLSRAFSFTLPSTCILETLRFPSVDVSWSSLTFLLQFFHLGVDSGLGVDCWPVSGGAWASAEFSFLSLPGITCVFTNQAEGGSWWEIAKTSPPALCAPSSEENCYILWTI